MKKGQDEPLGSLGNGGRAGKNKGEGKKKKQGCHMGYTTWHSGPRPTATRQQKIALCTYVGGIAEKYEPNTKVWNQTFPEK